MCIRNPIHCIIPPYITEHLAQAEDAQIRAQAVASLAAAQQIRGYRGAANPPRSLMAGASPNRGKHRNVGITVSPRDYSVIITQREVLS